MKEQVRKQIAAKDSRYAARWGLPGPVADPCADCPPDCKCQSPPSLLRRWDQHTLWPGSPGIRFNASILAYKDGYLLAYRDSWAGARIWLGRLDADLNPWGQPWKLDLRHEDAPHGVEDPRLFYHAGLVCVAFAGVVNKPWHTNILYADLAPGYQVVCAVHAPVYPGRSLWEKNWSFFEDEGLLRCVYGISPHRVLTVLPTGGDVAALSYNVWPGLAWEGGEPRGGARPCAVGKSSGTSSTTASRSPAGAFTAWACTPSSAAPLQAPAHHPPPPADCTGAQEHGAGGVPLWGRAPRGRLDRVAGHQRRAGRAARLGACRAGGAAGGTTVTTPAKLQVNRGLLAAIPSLLDGEFYYATDDNSLWVGDSGNVQIADGPGTGGTVTSVSVVTANGVAGSVATATTTPAITLALGAITPTSVAAVGAVTGSNLSGTNTGDQTTVSGNAGTVTVADAGGDTTTWPLLGTSQTGSLAPATDAGLTYNATTNALTTTTFIGALTGNADTVTTNANLTGDVTSVGNATTIGALKVTNAMLAGAIDLTAKVTGDLPFANLAQLAGVSVAGVTGSATADLAAITAGTDYHVLRRTSSNALAFGKTDGRSLTFVGADLYKTANQAIATATYTAVLFDGETIDTNTIHSLVSNTGRMTVPFAGKWLFYANIKFEAAAVTWQLGFAKNASLWMFVNVLANATTTQGAHVAQVLDLAANDYVEVWVHQASGVNRNVIGDSYTANYGCIFLGGA